MTTSDKPRGEGPAEIMSSGIEGLDVVLGGGFTPNRLYLIEGTPGTGKTTFGLQFLREGARRGERTLYVSLAESEHELHAIAASHGWSLQGVDIRELIPSEESLRPEQQYTMFHPSEVELSETIRAILDHAEKIRPRRVVFDTLSELRLLAGNALRYRRQILALKQFFVARNATMLMLDDSTPSEIGVQLDTIAHGVIRLEQLHPEYGAERRRLNVLKYRGAQYTGGFHDFTIEKGGLHVFPRVVAAEHRRTSGRAVIPSGIDALDKLLGGGLESGTSTLIAGASGTGKSSLAAQFAVAAASGGGRAAMFVFDESVETLIRRCDALDMPLRRHVDEGRITLQPVDPAELSPGQFADAVVRAARTPGTSIIVIDSLNGYLNAMPEERFLAIQLHELFAYLSHLGVATLLVGVHQGLIGSSMTTPLDASYLADSVILLRFFELRGEVRQAISVMKKRSSGHERTIREYRLGTGGIILGQPLREFRGVLTGVPVYEDSSDPARGKP